MALPPTAYVPVGSEFEQGRPLGSRVRFNGEGGIRKEWWWQAGPVDSCCCCCTLPTGVGVLAVLSFIGGIYSLFTLGTTPGQLAETEKMFADTCEGVAEPPSICAMLMTSMLNLELLNEYHLAFYLQGFLETVAGAIGMWAVAKHNAQGAKLFMWAKLPDYLMQLGFMAKRYHMCRQHEVGELWYQLYLGDIFGVILLAYYLKVIWSYRVTLMRRNRAAAAAASESAGSIELDGAHSTVV